MTGDELDRFLSRPEIESQLPRLTVEGRPVAILSKYEPRCPKCGHRLIKHRSYKTWLFRRLVLRCP